jgi:hypothetical protein
MQIVFGSILAISLLLAINFSGRIAAGQRIQAELGVLQATVGAERARATALKRDYDYVVSDAFVERWARSLEGMMVKPGEVLVLPLPGRATPVPPPTPAGPTVDSSFDDGPQNWALWWQLFFDGPPPGMSN